MKCWCDEIDYICSDCEGAKKWAKLSIQSKLKHVAYFNAVHRNDYRAMSKLINDKSDPCIYEMPIKIIRELEEELQN